MWPKVFWVISLDEQLLCLVAYRILIRNIDPKKCSGIGIGAPYLTRQCQFSQLLAISTCDCNQPTFTCWWRINNFEWMGKLENILYVKIVFACESMEKMTWFLCVCLSVYFFSGEISQNIGPQKYKGSLYSVSWGWRFLPWELQGPWSTPLAMHSSSVTCPCNSPGRMPSPVADIFFVYLQGTSLHENFERWDILENKNLHVNACSSLW